MFSNFNKKKLDELITNAKINLSAKRVNEKLITNAFRFALDAHKNDKNDTVKLILRSTAAVIFLGISI